MALPEAPDPPEPLAFEHRDRAVVKKGSRDRSTRGVFGVAFHGSSPKSGDLPQSALESGCRDSFTPVVPVHKETGDPPIRKVGQTLEISSLVLDARKLVWWPELTPADGARAVVHEGGVSLAFPDSTLLAGSVLRRGRVAPHTLGVEGHAPAATPNTVVLLGQAREVRPGGLVQRFHVDAGRSPPRRSKGYRLAEGRRARLGRAPRSDQPSHPQRPAYPQTARSASLVGKDQIDQPIPRPLRIRRTTGQIANKAAALSSGPRERALSAPGQPAGRPSARTALSLPQRFKHWQSHRPAPPLVALGSSRGVLRSEDAATVQPCPLRPHPPCCRSPSEATWA